MLLKRLNIKILCQLWCGHNMVMVLVNSQELTSCRLHTKSSCLLIIVIGWNGELFVLKTVNIVHTSPHIHLSLATNFSVCLIMSRPINDTTKIYIWTFCVKIMTKYNTGSQFYIKCVKNQRPCAQYIPTVSSVNAKMQFCLAICCACGWMTVKAITSLPTSHCAENWFLKKRCTVGTSQDPN